MSKENRNFENGEPTEKDQAVAEAIADDDWEYVFESLGGSVEKNPDIPDTLTSKEEALRDQNTQLAEEYKEKLNNPTEHYKDNTKTFYDNVRKGKNRILFFRVLVEDYPELRMSIKDGGITVGGNEMDDSVAVLTVPYESDRELIYKLSRLPSIRFLTENLLINKSLIEKGRDMEDAGDIPPDTVSRLVGRWLKIAKENTDDIVTIRKCQDKLKDLDVSPLTDEDLRDIMSKVIRWKLEELRDEFER